MAKRYDPTKFPSFDCGHVLSPRIDPDLRTCPDLHDCLSASIYMASQIELRKEGSTRLRVEKLQPIYFRASLSELCRTEDICKSQGKSLKFTATDDPLLHTARVGWVEVIADTHHCEDVDAMNDGYHYRSTHPTRAAQPIHQLGRCAMKPRSAGQTLGLLPLLCHPWNRSAR